MNDNRYRWILYTIVAVILGTITIQVYWNYKNYLINKKQLINDVQHSLDNAVESYFAQIAENKTIAFAYDINEPIRPEENTVDSIIQQIEITGRTALDLDSMDIESVEGDTLFVKHTSDSLLGTFNEHIQISKGPFRSVLKKLHIDSTSRHHFSKLTSKVIFSMTNDTIQLRDIDSLFREELSRKNIGIDHGLTFKPIADRSFFVNPEIVETASLKTQARSPFLDHAGTLTVHFSNETKIILKRILTGIIISTLLVLAVISCLFYLLKIIRHQKQLAEVKNDLISNITHEFKTPIATISVALESIKDFDILDDKQKTKNYLDMSSDQLTKLNLMVEKLLETATLDSDNLQLNKEVVNVSDMVKSIMDKHRFELTDKTLDFQSPEVDIPVNVDLFHFENAINNVIDNAIKYGGDKIEVAINPAKSVVDISISDDGQSLNKIDKDRIFEKFYRVSTGNTHDVKGFGIGLYYTRKIIEKHGGTIVLDLDNNGTCFKITLPYES
jgi:two-component system phosphate regulon sensor histidine kinase PhoR